ncbi:MAG: hypothetical protein QHH15_07230, partial [Candidatus Thermoplasmatota archaeon]|nr:hypothetical protein [Candidatus Thermoplasmatota archaeon]
MTNVLIDGLKERISNAIKVNQSIGIILPSSNYHELLQSLFEHIRNNPNEAWVYVTANKPYQHLLNDFPFLEDYKNIRFIDCISRAAGIIKTNFNCTLIESPTMLEKLVLEIMNLYKEVDDKIKKFLVLDSLTNLFIYNDPEIITEFFYLILNRTRAKNIHIISIAIEEEELDKYI